MHQSGHRVEMADGYRSQGSRGPTFGPRGARLRPTGIVVFATLDRDGRAHGCTYASAPPSAPWHDTEADVADGWRRRVLRPMTWLLGR
jgi:hypothetical protein